MERNYHGFAFEKYIIERFHLIKNNSYTAKWDGFINDIPVSIKHIKKNNAIDLGDLFRQASIVEEFFLIVGFYNNSQDFDNDDIYILHFFPYDWHLYFMDLKDFEEKFKKSLDSVSNDKADDVKWTALRKECINFWKNNTSGYISVNGKRDHKKQKRWQCSINKTNFFKIFIPKYTISKEDFLDYAKRD